MFPNLIRLLAEFFLPGIGLRILASSWLSTEGSSFLPGEKAPVGCVFVCVCKNIYSKQSALGNGKYEVYPHYQE